MLLLHYSPGEENDGQYPPISSSTTEVHGHDGSSGTPFTQFIIILGLSFLVGVFVEQFSNFVHSWIILNIWFAQNLISFKQIHCW